MHGNVPISQPLQMLAEGLRRFPAEDSDRSAAALAIAGALLRHGREVQVEPVKSMFKPTGTERLNLRYDGLLSNFAFQIQLSMLHPC